MADYTFTSNIDRPILASSLQAQDDVVGSYNFTFNHTHNVLKVGYNNTVNTPSTTNSNISIIGANNTGYTSYGAIIGNNLNVASSYATVIGYNSTFRDDINGSIVLTRNHQYFLGINTKNSVGLINNLSYVLLNEETAHVMSQKIKLTGLKPPFGNYPPQGQLPNVGLGGAESSIFISGTPNADYVTTSNNIYYVLTDDLRIDMSTLKMTIDTTSILYPQQKKMIYAAANLQNMFKNALGAWTGYTAKYSGTISGTHYCYLQLPLDRICQYFNCETSAVKTYTYTIYITKPFISSGSDAELAANNAYVHTSVISLYPGSSSTICDIDKIINSNTYMSVGSSAPISGGSASGAGWNFTQANYNVNLNFISKTANTDVLAGAYAPRLLDATVKFEVEWY